MFIPRYWAEASHREALHGRRQITLRRFGWSSASQEEAEVHARQRLEEALDVLYREGEKAAASLLRRERVVAYSGGQGLPIREEIVREWDGAQVVVTRNVYGALCLNTPQAMFVDVDADLNSGSLACLLLPLTVLPFVILGGIVNWRWSAFVCPGVVVGAFVGTLLFAVVGAVADRIRRAVMKRYANPAEWVRQRVEAWCAERPGWRVRLYRTPGGVRLLAMHRPFEPTEPEARAFMDFVDADRHYVRMCELQKCFRARVSPKPWRIGMKRHFKAGGTWPVRDPAKLAARRKWVVEYDALASGHASCSYVESLGQGSADPRIEEVRRIHDDLAGAETRLDPA